jgi:hypothetical protein
MATVYDGDDIVDSRNIIERIEELETDLDDAASEDEEYQEAHGPAGDTLHYAQWVVDLGAYGPNRHLWYEEAYEFLELCKFRDEAQTYCRDWRHGETFIKETYFPEYAQQLADDCGMLPRDQRWPLNHIDWGAAAEELRQDYRPGRSKCPIT